MEHFLQSVLQFPEESFDGVLVWDCLQFLTPSLLTLAVERLHRVLRPGSSLLAIFNAEEKLAPVPTFSFRIQDHRTLAMVPRGPRSRRRFSIIGFWRSCFRISNRSSFF